ncbi:MAG TPA: hypothetical protein DCE42_02420 [Myxococcales bacterium]|nr:hypothetical protein [Myxococcales bacterium]
MAADVLNRPKDFMAVRRLINQQAVVDCERLADETIPLREVA